jgi:hypothetical protein
LTFTPYPHGLTEAAHGIAVDYDLGAARKAISYECVGIPVAVAAEGLGLRSAKSISARKAGKKTDGGMTTLMTF